MIQYGSNLLSTQDAEKSLSNRSNVALLKYTLSISDSFFQENLRT